MKSQHIVLFAFTLLVASCATVKSSIDPGATPNATTAVIFGRSEFVLDGEVAEGNSTIMSHLSRFTGVAQINRNKYVPGDFAFPAHTRDRGWFAINVPPGKYYFVEYAYQGFGIGLYLLPNLFGTRSYMEIALGADPQVPHPFLTLVDLAPGKATYIGTMSHNWSHVTDDKDSKVTLLAWELAIRDERADAKAWLAKHYPEWSSRMVTRLAERRNIDP
jgi:hypothetical protein